MTDWLPEAGKIIGIVIGSAFGAGGPVVLYYRYRLRRLDTDREKRVADAEIDRQAKHDEAEILQGQIRRLDRRCQQLEEKIDELQRQKDLEVAALKTELTAALIENGRLQIQEENLKRHNEQLTKRVESLEATVAALQKET